METVRKNDFLDEVEHSSHQHLIAICMADAYKMERPENRQRAKYGTLIVFCMPNHQKTNSRSSSLIVSYISDCCDKMNIADWFLIVV